MHPRATALERERECQNSVREWQLWSGNVGFFTWRSPSDTYIYVYIYVYIHILHTYMCIYKYIYSIDETTASQLDFLLNYIYIQARIQDFSQGGVRFNKILLYARK